FFVLLRPPRCSTLFPYTTLFRSGDDQGGFVAADVLDRDLADLAADACELDHVFVQAGAPVPAGPGDNGGLPGAGGQGIEAGELGDRKSTRLNSSHVAISYAVFCL